MLPPAMEGDNSGSNMKVYSAAGFPEGKFGAQNRGAAEGLPLQPDQAQGGWRERQNEKAAGLQAKRLFA
jgi:hypothetical protein